VKALTCANPAETASDWTEGVEALGWPVAGGSHERERCHRFRSGGHLGIPAGELFYVGPEMVARYVIEHEHSPPAELVRAIMEAPMPGSAEHAAAVSAFAFEQRG
jgi:hypothetical protein